MTRRASDVSALTIGLSLRERDVFDAMKAAGRFCSDADVLRVALYRFATHLDVPIDTDIFHVRSGAANRVRHPPRSRQSKLQFGVPA